MGNANAKVKNNTSNRQCVLTFNKSDIGRHCYKNIYSIEAGESIRVEATPDAIGLQVAIIYSVQGKTAARRGYTSYEAFQVANGEWLTITEVNENGVTATTSGTSPSGAASPDRGTFESAHTSDFRLAQSCMPRYENPGGQICFHDAQSLVDEAAKWNIRLDLTISRREGEKPPTESLLKAYGSRPLEEDEFPSFKEVDIDHCFLCSVPLTGAAGAIEAGRHEFILLVNSAMPSVAYAFEFGPMEQSLVTGKHVNAKSQVRISALPISIPDASAASASSATSSPFWKQAAAAINSMTWKSEYFGLHLELFDYHMRVEDEVHMLQVEERCQAKMTDAIFYALKLGNRPYSLATYNCKSFAQGMYFSIHKKQIIPMEDAGRDVAPKTVAAVVFAAGSVSPRSLAPNV